MLEPETLGRGTAAAPRWHWLFVAAIVVVLISGSLAIREYTRFSAATTAVEHAYLVLTTTDEVLGRLLDVEAARRGYLLTGDARLLRTLEREAAVDDAAGRLERLVVDNPPQLARARELAALGARTIGRLAGALPPDGRNPGPPSEAASRLAVARGQEDLDAVRTLGEHMKAAERTLLGDREAQARLARRAALLFAGSSLMVAVTLGFVAVRVDRGFIRRRVAFEHALAGRLSAERSMRSAAQELFRSERLNRSLLDCSADCIQLLDPDGRLVLMNESGRRLLDIDDPSAFQGLPWPELWGESAGVARQGLQAAAAEGTARFRAFCPTTHGVPKWWDVIVTPIRDADGALARLMCISRDITEQTRIDEERTQLLASERAARAEAERAVHLKDEFLATLSHELRTPLNAILGWVGVLKQDRSTQTTEKAIAVIDRNARRQSQVIDDLLDVSRIVSGRLRLDVQRIDLAPIVEDTLNAARPSADARGVRVLAESIGAAWVQGDPVRLQQVIWNLVSNGIKFTGPGGAVRVSVRTVGPQAQVQVADTGEGLSPEMLPEIFQRFRQGDSSASRPHGGLGLGLAIVKNVVEMHGGSVEAASDGPGRGATFTVRLHLGEADVARAGRDGSARSLLAGITALVVEDEPESRELVERLLQDAGARVVGCPSADAALERIDEGVAPDVVVSDVGMPGADGYHFVRRLRDGSGPEAHVPAIALTGHTRAEDRERAATAGYQVHLAKPVDAGELIATVASLVGRGAPGA
ncbi:MAG: ATP-binding protein [Vicinamibacterales bacterium]